MTWRKLSPVFLRMATGGLLKALDGTFLGVAEAAAAAAAAAAAPRPFLNIWPSLLLLLLLSLLRCLDCTPRPPAAC